MSNADSIAVLDLETTGLGPRANRIVEIGIVVISPDGTILTEYDTLVNPNRDIGPSSIHQISASDVLNAPVFAQIAGDVAEILSQTAVLAGHNIAFDKNFLVSEYERLGASFPNLPLFDTLPLFGRNSLPACCHELGIPFNGIAHRAISDARATALLVSFVLAENPAILDTHKLDYVSWPRIPPLGTPCFTREHASREREKTPTFLQRLTTNLHHDTEAEPSTILHYQSLLDRVLEDRVISEIEEKTLEDAILELKLSATQVEKAHQSYLHTLAVSALKQGPMSRSERQDLERVAVLLGQSSAALDRLLESVATQFCPDTLRGPPGEMKDCELQGLRVCFTGELQASIKGKPITRDIAEALAEKAGLIVASNVTKKLDLLVVADPHTRSGKANKARQYGIRIMSDAVFWRKIGADVD